MADTIETPSFPFAVHYGGRLPTDRQFQRLPGWTVDGHSSQRYINSRIGLMNRMIGGEVSHQTKTFEGLAVEGLTTLALNPLLEDAGFLAELAPMSLEHGGTDAEGKVAPAPDILITDDEGLIYLGMNIKIRLGDPREGIAKSEDIPTTKEDFPLEIMGDGHGFDDNLKSPCLYLALGDWRPNSRERDEITIRDWIREYAAPSFRKNDDLPLFNDFRKYLVRRIDRNISSFKEDLAMPEIYPHVGDIPFAEKDRTILRDKLGVMQELFSAIAMNT